MMKVLLSTLLVTAAALTASAQSGGAGSTAAAPKVIELWPEGVPGLRGDASDEKMVNGRVVNVHRPTLTVFAPERVRSNGTAVIFCPGGGYVRLAVGSLTAGPPEARRLLDLGVTVFVLRYRMVEYGHPAPLRDVLRAVRLVRSRASEFGVRADRIGLLGVSAGGHLAASAALMFDAAEGRMKTLTYASTGGKQSCTARPTTRRTPARSKALRTKSCANAITSRSCSLKENCGSTIFTTSASS